jgi:hypothetical protein
MKLFYLSDSFCQSSPQSPQSPLLHQKNNQCSPVKHPPHSHPLHQPTPAQRTTHDNLSAQPSQTSNTVVKDTAPDLARRRAGVMHLSRDGCVRRIMRGGSRVRVVASRVRGRFALMRKGRVWRGRRGCGMQMRMGREVGDRRGGCIQHLVSYLVELMR